MTNTGYDTETGDVEEVELAEMFVDAVNKHVSKLIRVKSARVESVDETSYSMKLSGENFVHSSVSIRAVPGVGWAGVIPIPKVGSLVKIYEHEQYGGNQIVIPVQYSEVDKFLIRIPRTSIYADTNGVKIYKFVDTAAGDGTEYAKTELTIHNDNIGITMYGEDQEEIRSKINVNDEAVTINKGEETQLTITDEDISFTTDKFYINTDNENEPVGRGQTIQDHLDKIYDYIDSIYGILSTHTHGTPAGPSTPIIPPDLATVLSKKPEVATDKSTTDQVKSTQNFTE